MDWRGNRRPFKSQPGFLTIPDKTIALWKTGHNDVPTLEVVRGHFIRIDRARAGADPFDFGPCVPE